MVSPKQLAVAIGVSESSLKRWADEGLLVAVRTAGGHRRIPLPEAVRFIRHMGLKVVQPAEIGLTEEDASVAEWHNPTEVSAAFSAAVENGESAKAKHIIQSCFLAGWSAASIADGPLRDALVKIGTMWQHAEWGIVVEHRATDICLQTINLLRTLLPARREGAPVALGGAGDSDPYMIPSLCAAVSLAEIGFNEVNLGPMTPARVLCNAIDHYKPALVWVSISHDRPHDALLRDMADIRTAAERHHASLVIGGRAVSDLSPSDLAGYTLARSMTELVAFARGRCGHLLQQDGRPNG